MKTTQKIFSGIFLLGIGFAAGLIASQHTATAKETSIEAHAPASPAEYTNDNCIMVFDETKVQPTAAGYAFWFVPQGFAQDGVDLKMSYVDKGQATHPPHQHDNEEVFFVLEGNVIVHLNGKEVTLGPNSSMYCPKGSFHGIRRADDKPARYLVINNHGISRHQ